MRATDDQEWNRTEYGWSPDIDYRVHPDQYRVGKGEQGVLICKPYKDELLPLWRFKTPAIAKTSSAAIYARFLTYLSNDEFPGADLARKFLQMGFTRARRYTNYKGGRKYAAADGHALERGTGDPEKAVCAQIFYDQWQRAEREPRYARRKADWKQEFG